MTRKEIEDRMTLPILNLCLAVLSRTHGDLEKATIAVFDATEKIALDTPRRDDQS
jgi:hypothetical protein